MIKTLSKVEIERTYLNIIHHVNTMKDKSYMIVSTDAERASDEI